MNNGNKPRLAEMLGVEVGESFMIPNNGGSVTFEITADGHFKTCPPNQTGSTYLLLDAINHPEKIILISRLTQKEEQICSAVGAKWASRDVCSLWVDLWSGKPIMSNEAYRASKGTVVLGRISSNLFPSLKDGDCVNVDNI